MFAYPGSKQHITIHVCLFFFSFPLTGLVRKRTKERGLWLRNFPIYDTKNNANVGFRGFWSRCLNTAILGFTEKEETQQFNKIINFDIVLPAWGLTAKVHSANKGGRVLRPWKGKIYINMEGRLQWERPESIIDM